MQCDVTVAVPPAEVSGLGTVAVVSVAIAAQLSQPELKALAEYYRNRLLALPEVPMVDVSGFSTHEFSVLIEAETLRRYRLSIQDIAELIRNQAVDLPAGVLKGGQRWYQIRVENERRSVEELADLVVLNDERGGQLRLGDIATIADEFTDRGHAVAILSPIEDAATPLDRLIASGRASRPGSWRSQPGTKPTASLEISSGKRNLVSSNPQRNFPAKRPTANRRST